MKGNIVDNTEIDWSEQETALCIFGITFGSPEAQELCLKQLSFIAGQEITYCKGLLVTTGDMATLYKVKEKIQEFEIKGQRINQYLRWLI